MTTWEDAYERLFPGIPIEELTAMERARVGAFLLTNDPELKAAFTVEIRAAIQRDQDFYADFLAAHRRLKRQRKTQHAQAKRQLRSDMKRRAKR